MGQPYHYSWSDTGIQHEEIGFHIVCVSGLASANTAPFFNSCTDQMNTKIRIFIFSAGLILGVSAIAKFISSEGSATVLQQPDPILIISFKHIFWIVGTIELAVAFVSLFSRQLRLQVYGQPHGCAAHSAANR